MHFPVNNLHFPAVEVLWLRGMEADLAVLVFRPAMGDGHCTVVIGVGYLNTPDMNYRVELFSGYITDMNSHTYDISFATEEGNQQWLDSIIAQSAFSSNVEVKPGDKILTLSTCTYEYDDARFVVHGKMVPIH